MRSLILIFALFACATSTTSLAAVAEFDCDACRDVYDYPRDFGNHAFNLVFGTAQVIDLAEGGRVRITNPAGQSAEVDLNIVLVPTTINLSIVFVSYQVMVPNGLIEIRVQDPRGNLSTYEVLADSPDLEVGGTTTTSTEVQEPEPAATTEPEPEDPSKPGGAGGGTEIIDWGAAESYYWFDSSAYFDITITGTM